MPLSVSISSSSLPPFTSTVLKFIAADPLGVICDKRTQHRGRIRHRSLQQKYLTHHNLINRHAEPFIAIMAPAQAGYESPQNSGTRDIPKGYFRGRVLDQYSVNAVSSVLRNHSATSFAWKGRSSRSKSRLSNSVISPAVLGFLILFNARTMCSLRQRLELGIFFIAASTVSKN